MSGELHEISAAIGELRAEVRHLHDCTHAVGEKVDKLSDDLTLDKADLAKLKAKGAGLLVGVSLASGFAGSKVGAVLAALGRMTGN